MLNVLTHKILLIAPLFIVGGIINTQALAAPPSLQDNIEVSSSASKIEYLKLEHKINKSLFLPELNLNGGFGLEKLQDNDYELEKGPFLYLESKLNLYRGGRDSGLQKINELELSSMKLEREIQIRNTSIASFKITSAINLITKELKLIKEELNNNKSQKLMAQKKLNAGLTTSIDLIDFDLKDDALTNELDMLELKKETLKKELIALFGGNLSEPELDIMLVDSSDKTMTASASNYNNSVKIAHTKKQIDLSAVTQKNVKAEYLPSIDLEAKWGQITPHESFTKNSREYAFLVNVSFPLFSGFNTDYKFQQSVLESTQKEKALRQTETEEKSLFDLESKKIELAKKVLVSLNRSLAQSIQYKNLTVGEYKRGIKNSSDIISASDKKLEIERKILETQNELAISQITLNETFKTYSGE